MRKQGAFNKDLYPWQGHRERPWKEMNSENRIGKYWESAGAGRVEKPTSSERGAWESSSIAVGE